MGRGQNTDSRVGLFISILVWTLAAAPAGANTSTPTAPASYLEKAERELAPPTGRPPVLTSATVAIREDITAREALTSRWSLGLFAQSFKPGGIGSRRGLGDYPLADLDAAPLFRLEGRWHLNSVTHPWGTWLPQVTLQGSYSRQDVDLTTATGFRYQETRLSTLLTSAGLRMGLRPQRSQQLELAAGFSAGQALNFQTSRSDSATFSKNEWYAAASLGARLFLVGQWSLEAMLEQRRSLAARSVVDLGEQNFLVGVNWGRGQ
ncbi:MAG: hypothetical protein IT288_13515 [Bdellovibrionales bacterium]|nr:hypothetical protein [Bdellovibrionales bacterium]